MCAIDASSTDSSVLPMKSPWSAPAYGGRTTRPCSMPGTRMSCTKTSSPASLGRNVDARRPSVPTIAVVGRVLGLRPWRSSCSTRALAARPARRSRRAGPALRATRTMPSRTCSASGGTPSRSAARASSQCARLRRRHGAAAPHGSGSTRWRCVAPWLGALAVSPSTMRTQASGRSSSSATICASAVLDAGAQVDVAVERGDAAVVPDGEQDLVALDGVARDQGGLALGRRRRGRRLAHATSSTPLRAGTRRASRQVGAARHGAGCTSAHPHGRALHGAQDLDVRAAAAQVARQFAADARLVGCGSRASSAAACITMPFRQ